ncbi:MAG: DUF192 domain-containing protein [Woeseiaceae bacterium]|nr:DUF192 domain-containing protein [Woeseiaceae bacterium]
MRPAILACLVLLATSALANEELDARFEKDVLLIEASRWACYRFDIYVAQTESQRNRGLMFVRELPATTGMLFVYAGDRVASMWMKNTFISLDMLFIRYDGTVSSVIANTEPQSLKSQSAVEPVTFVLELNAGTAARLAIDDNSRIFWEPVHGRDN